MLDLDGERAAIAIGHAGYRLGAGAVLDALLYRAWRMAKLPPATCACATTSK
jgi:hypothetical protein